MLFLRRVLLCELKIGIPWFAVKLFSMILLYIFKWGLRREIPFKQWWDKKRDTEYLMEDGFVTLFMKVIKNVESDRA